MKKVKSAERLTKTFFQDRIVDRPNAHIKAFAGECLTAVVLLGFFVDVVIAPRKIAALEYFIDCFQLLRMILQVLQGGDIGKVPLLRDMLRLHQQLFLQCYPLCNKPKNHQVLHIPDFWVPKRSGPKAIESKLFGSTASGTGAPFGGTCPHHRV